MLSKRFRTKLASSASTMALALAASFTVTQAGHAQQQAATEPVVEEVVVTGTHIQANGFTAPVPTTVLSQDSIQQTALPNIADVLNQLPQLTGSSTPSTGNGNVAGGTAGRNILSLRSLGTTPAVRTLVLMDGIRVVPGGIDGIPDINNIPSQLIQRVDIVTGGASATYGSDAVTGVVNFVIDKNFTGFKGEFVGGLSSRNDDASKSANLNYGTDIFGGKAHLLLSGSYSDSDGVKGIGANRDWYKSIHEVPNPAFVSATATPNIPALLVLPDRHYFDGGPGGTIVSGPNAGTSFGPGGTLSQYPGYSTLTSNFTTGSTGSPDFGTRYSLAQAVSTRTVFSNVNFDVNDDISAFTRFNYGYSHTYGYSSPLFTFLGPVTIAANNPFTPAALAGQTFRVSSGLADLTLFPGEAGQVRTNNKRQTYQGTFGLDGKLAGSWKWKGYYQYGETDSVQLVENMFNTKKFNNAVQAVIGPNGTPICAINSATPPAGTTPDPACVPLNIMGTGVASPGAIAYVLGNTEQHQVYKQQVAEVSASGEAFDLWAGPVSVAVGMGWRREAVKTPYIDPTSATAPAVNWAGGTWKAFAGSYNVTEGFGEVVVPLAKDEAWAKSLNLDLAGRITNYSTSGTVETWKAGLNYVPEEQFLVRGTISRDIRAPNLGEIFGGAPSLTPPTNDPLHGNLLTNPTVNFGTNPNIQPETSRSYGLGVVYSPSWLSGFTGSVDYWQMNLKKAISTLTGQAVVNGCVTGTNPSYCQFITRGPGTESGVFFNDSLLTINAISTNLASAWAKGIDFEFAYRKDLDEWFSNWHASFALRALGTWNITNRINSGGAVLVHQLAGELSGVNSAAYPPGAIPSWKWNVEATYNEGNWTASSTVRYISSGVLLTSFFDTSAAAFRSVDKNNVPAIAYVDLGLSYKFQIGPADMEIFGRVSNVFDKAPPVIPSTSNFSQQYNPILYDGIGRYYRAGVRFKM